MSDEKLISHYRIVKEAGRGGMASVYLAQDTRIDRQVAIKVLPSYFVHDPQFKARFLQEAQTVMKLSHPNIVPVYEYGVEGDEPYLVMAYMAGGTLADRIAKGPVPLDEAIEILTPIASALDYAHSAGIVHRDLKPGNILFSESDHAYLADFGVVKLAEATRSFTGSAIIGTPAYMSPEQVKGDKRIDGRSDIYALGIILYEMLTGEVPYKGDTPTQQLMKHVLEPAPRVRAVRPEIPAEVEMVILSALAKEPEQRYPTGRAFVSALANPLAARGPQTFITAPAAVAASVPPPPAQPPPPPAPAATRQPASPPQTEVRHVDYEPLPALGGGRRGSSGRNLGFAALAAILLLVVGGGAAAFFLRDTPPEPTPTVTVDEWPTTTPTPPPPTDTPPPTVDHEATVRAIEVIAQETLDAAEANAAATLTAIANRNRETSVEATVRAEAQATVYAVETRVAATLTAAAVEPPTVTPSITAVRIPTGVIAAPVSANMRSGPDTAFPIMRPLPDGMEVEIIGRSSDQLWWHVELPDGSIGWVSVELVIPENTTNVPIIQNPPTPTSTPTLTRPPTSTPTPTPVPSRPQGAALDARNARLGFVDVSSDDISGDSEGITYTLNNVGGNLDVSGNPFRPSNCVGYVYGTNPDVRIDYYNPSDQGSLTIYFVSNTDTTLVVFGPGVSWYCDDDSGGDNSPKVVILSGISGTYYVWVGTYSGGQTSGTLGITR